METLGPLKGIYKVILGVYSSYALPAGSNPRAMDVSRVPLNQAMSNLPLRDPYLENACFAW